MIKKITTKAFKPYGWVIEYPNKNSRNKKKNLFRIVMKESGPFGWRIAYLIVKEKAIDKLEQHSNSFESFEPVRGRSLLYVSDSRDHKKIECFLLDRPVILKKKMWHGLVSLDNETEIKITENAKVKCVYWTVGFSL